MAACAAGELSPREASEIMGLIKTHVGTIEIAELEARVDALENERARRAMK
jgi:hypothetical protein